MVKSIFTSKRSLLVALATMALSLSSLNVAAEYTALSGTGGTGNEGYAKLVDGNDKTKWGMTFVTGETEAYVIFKSDVPVIPTNYTIFIANDTQGSPGRNWQSWNVYAANFSSDEEATADSEGWVLVDKKLNEVVPTDPFLGVEYFTSEGIMETFTYFKVEVTATVQPTSVYMQMSEFVWGTAQEFYNSTKPGYTVLEGTKHDGSGECVDKMFDGNTGTKWFNGLSDGDDVYVIFKSTRDIAPTYYCITTANDNYSYTGRNWTEWRLYGLTADDDSKVTREASWELIDERIDCHDIPDANYTEVYFAPNGGNTTKYHYFMLVPTKSAGDSFQISEFFLGDEITLALDKKDHYKALQIDLSKPMQKSLVSDYNATVEKILSAADIFEMGKLYQEALNAQTLIKNSINAYDSYINLVASMRNHYEQHDCITGEGRTLIGNYLDTEVAPCETYPNGSYSYILANCLLDVDGINEEAIFVNMMLEKYASDLTEGAIDVTYTAIGGRGGFGNEEYDKLVDGDEDTKWCSDQGDYWIVFKASEPIAPTYYRLVLGGDTGKYPERNWKSWKIYGANFESYDDVYDQSGDDGPIRQSDQWVLLDDKQNVGTDQLPAENHLTTFLYMNKASATPYEYFLLEISEPDGLIQMCELSFGNGANFILNRQDFCEKFEEERPTEDVVACKKYLEEYDATLALMQRTASIVELGYMYNTLTALQEALVESEELYIEFDFAVEEVRAATGYMTGDLEEYWNAFISDDIEPNDQYPYGSYSYIMANLQVKNEEMAAYVAYLNTVAKAALEGGFCVVSGNMEDWGENENYAKLVDKDLTTKWGGALKAGGSYVIFYTMTPAQPMFYKLTTGNDTESNPGRNWKDWQVYGANFAQDADATADAEGWVLLDNRTGVGQDRLPAANFVTVPFGFTEGVSEEYKYFKVVITAAYSGSSIQMTEFEFGTEKEAEEIMEQYRAELEGLNVEGIIATESLLNAYYDAEENLVSSDDVEQVYQAYITMKDTYEKILLSASVYEIYQEKVAAMKAATANFEASDELAVLNAYLNDEVEAGEQFPNGSAATVVAQHLLNNNELMAEVDFMNSLAKAALLKGYVAGTDITAMVVNPSFAQGAEGWEGEVFGYNYNAEFTSSAAEFCNELSLFDISQTLTGLKNGYYLVGMNGGFRSQGDIYADNYAAVLYANDNVTYIQSVNDDMIAKEDAVDRVNCWLGASIPDKPILSEDGEGTDTLGYVLWGVQSCCYAFQAGRYQNYVVAQVTDGTLTFGAKNEGTQNGGDWTGLGNTTIKYLGEDLESEAAIAALDLALEYEAKLVNSLGEYEGFYDEADYKTKPFVNEAAYKTLSANASASLSTGSDKYAAVVSNSNCFKTIYDCKNAYVKAIDDYKAVTGKWDAHAELMSDADNTAYGDATYTVLEGCMGLYAADEAIKAGADLKAKYPCYVDLDPTKSKGSLEITETAPFEYEITADGNRPNIGLNKMMYEALPEDQFILSFEYKCNSDLTGGCFYLAHPSLTTTDFLNDFESLPAANEWKKAYVSLFNGFGWGTSTDHWIRWDLASSGTFNVSVRNMIMVTEAQMKAEGGEVLNTGIDNTVIETEVPETFIYNVMGQRVGKDYKGITIQGGKKIFSK